jgi:hypothetical protein
LRNAKPSKETNTKIQKKAVSDMEPLTSIKQATQARNSWRKRMSEDIMGARREEYRSSLNR